VTEADNRKITANLGLAEEMFGKLSKHLQALQQTSCTPANLNKANVHKNHSKLHPGCDKIYIEFNDLKKTFAWLGRCLLNFAQNLRLFEKARASIGASKESEDQGRRHRRRRQKFHFSTLKIFIFFLHFPLF